MSHNVSFSCPDELHEYLESVSGGNKSEYLRELLKKDREGRGMAKNHIAESWVDEAETKADHHRRMAELNEEKADKLRSQMEQGGDKLSETVEDAIRTLSGDQIEIMEPDHAPAQHWSTKANTDAETFVDALKEAYNDA